jgi:hypothetical protein
MKRTLADSLAVATESKKTRATKSRPVARNRKKTSVANVLAFPSGAPLPDEMLSSEVKDRISDVVKKAVSGGRTTVLSRGYAIAIVGPLADIPEEQREEATRLPTTDIKSGQTSIKGVVARTDWTVLTIHGQERAALYRPVTRHQPAKTEDKLDRLIGLLEGTQAAQRLVQDIEFRIERSLALLEKLDNVEAQSLRAEYAALKKR